MEEFKEIAPLPRLHLRDSGSRLPDEESLYANDTEDSGASPLPPGFRSGPHPFYAESTFNQGLMESADSIASGTFGHLVKSINKDDEGGKGQKVRFNLFKVGPKRHPVSGDFVEAWREHQF